MRGLGASLALAGLAATLWALSAADGHDMLGITDGMSPTEAAEVADYVGRAGLTWGLFLGLGMRYFAYPKVH